jgi:actin-related protein 2
MVFLGGAVLANLVRSWFPFYCRAHPFTYRIMKQIADKEDMWVTKQEWEEQGARALAKLGPR